MSAAVLNTLEPCEAVEIDVAHKVEFGKLGLTKYPLMNPTIIKPRNVMKPARSPFGMSAYVEQKSVGKHTRKGQAKAQRAEPDMTLALELEEDSEDDIYWRTIFDLLAAQIVEKRLLPGVNLESVKGHSKFYTPAVNSVFRSSRPMVRLRFTTRGPHRGYLQTRHGDRDTETTGIEANDRVVVVSSSVFGVWVKGVEWGICANVQGLYKIKGDERDGLLP